MSRAQRVLNLLKAPLMRYNEVAQNYPFETGVVTTVVKTSLADMFAQKVSSQQQGLYSPHRQAAAPAALSCLIAGLQAAAGPFSSHALLLLLFCCR